MRKRKSRGWKRKFDTNLLKVFVIFFALALATLTIIDPINDENGKISFEKSLKSSFDNFENLLTGAAIGGKDSVGTGVPEEQISVAVGGDGGQLTIQSTEVENVTLNSTYGTNYTNENLTVHYDLTNSSDKAIINWYLDDRSLTTLNMPFEGGSSNTFAKDYSPYGNNISSVGGTPTWQSTGGFDGKGAFTFNGNDYLLINYSPSIDTMSEMTFEVRAYPTSLAGNNVIFSKDIDSVGDAGTEYQLRFEGTQLTMFWRHNTSFVPFDDLRLKGSFSTNNWYHIVVTISESLGTAVLYSNGEIVAIGDVTSTSRHINRSQLNIGRDNRGGGEFDGTIDEVRIWNWSLTQEQVVLLYQNRTDLIYPTETHSGQKWMAAVTPNNGTTDGTTKYSNNLTISGFSAENVTLNSSSGNDYPTDNLTVNYDLTNGSDRAIINWYVDGESITLLNMPFEGGSTSGQTLLNGFTKDYSGHGNNGTVYVGTTWINNLGHDGKGAYDFDGVDDYIKVPKTDSFNLNGINFTVSFWVKSHGSSFSTYASERLFYNIPHGIDVLFRRDNNGIDAHLYEAGLITSLKAYDQDYYDQNWHHVVVVNDRGLNKSFLYVDGEKKNESEAAFITSDSADLILGNPTDLSRDFNGSIDDVLVFNRTLSAEQIKALFQNRTDLIVANETQINETWNASVTPNDGYEDGVTKWSNSLTILDDTNYMPVIENVTLNSTSGTNLTTENLTLYFDAYDPDSDPVKNITNWYVNGTSITLLNMPFEGGSKNGNSTGVTNGTRDYSSYENNGTVYNATWNSTGGYDGKGAYEFNGISDSIGISSNITLPTEGSISVWINPNSYYGDDVSNVIFNCYEEAGKHLVINKRKNHADSRYNNTIQISYKDGSSSTYYTIDGATYWKQNEWHHFVFTWNSSDNTRNIYFDGSGTSPLWDNSNDLPPDGNIHCEIGEFVDTGYFNGTIDEFMLFSRILTEDQIKAIYNNRTDLIVSQETVANEIWNASVTPNDGNQDGTTVWSNSLTIQRVQLGILPNSSSFDGSTTNFSQESDLNYVDNLVLENISHGIIRWLQGNRNVSGANFDAYVKFGNGWVWVDSANLNENLNSSANITLYNLSFNAMPVVYQDTVLCSDCNAISYNGGNFTFNVTHFTNYSTGANANLTIYDEYEGSSVGNGTNITFFANYTNITSSNHIPGATCNISFDDGVSVIMSEASNNYNYTKVGGFDSITTHYWNVTCNKTEHEPLNSTDDIEVVLNCEDNDGDGINVTGGACGIVDCNDNDASTIPPYDGMQIQNNTLLCDGTYYINTTAAQIIEIVASNLTLECNQTIVVGNSSGNAIKVNDTFNVTVVNCTFVNYSNGIVVQDANLTNIIENKFYNLSDKGIYSKNNNNLTVSHNIIYDGNGLGIHLISGSDNEIYNNSLQNLVSQAIFLQSVGTQNKIYNNTITNISQQGIDLLSSGSGNEIYNNIINFTQQEGIKVNGTNDTLIRGNTISNTSTYSISLNSLHSNVTISNNIISLVSYGIFIDQGIDNLVYNNTLSLTSNTPITSQNTVGLNITENYIHDTSRGIDASGSDVNITISNNVLENTGSGGIKVDSGDNVDVFNNSVTNTTNHAINMDFGSTNVRVYNNRVNTSANSILISSSNNANVTGNTVFSGSIRSEVAVGTYIYNNTCIGTGVYLSNATNNTVTDNNISSGSIILDDYLNSPSSGNYLINNTIVRSDGNPTIQFLNATINYIIYKNQNGEVNWTINVSTTTHEYTNLSLGINPIVNNNLLAFTPVNGSDGGLLNSNATITLYDVIGLNAFPVVLKNGTLCDPSICSEILNLGNDDYQFNVTQFSNYSLANGTNANLSIWDMNDPEGGNLNKSIGEQITFFANYTNRSDSTPINSSMSGSCNITFNVTPNGPFAMIYNSTSLYWEYNRSFSSGGNFSWNVTCDAPNFSNLNATNNVSVLLACADNDGDGFGVCPYCNTTIGCTYNGDDCNDNDTNIFPPALYFNLGTSVTFCSGTYTFAPAEDTNVINITSSNIEIKCNNTIISEVSGGEGYGRVFDFIVGGGTSNVTIQDCQINDFSEHIKITGSGNGITILNNTLSDSNSATITASSLTNSFVVNNTISGSGGNAITVSGGNNVSVLNNNISNFDRYVAFNLSSTDNCNINNNIIIGINDGAFLLDQSHNNTFVNNQVNGSGELQQHYRASKVPRTYNGVDYKDCMWGGECVVFFAGGNDYDIISDDWNTVYAAPGTSNFSLCLMNASGQHQTWFIKSGIGVDCAALSGFLGADPIYEELDVFVANGFGNNYTTNFNSTTTLASGFTATYNLSYYEFVAYSIKLTDSYDNSIYNNYFNSTYNAFDNATGSYNYWNTSKTSASPSTNIIGGPYLGGNYWSDYTGVDTDGDGLGNTLVPYNSSDNITTGGDYLPLTTISQLPSVVTPSGGGGGGARRECEDNVDNDDDGLVDYPSDPGCGSYSDDNETDIVIEEETEHMEVWYEGDLGESEEVVEIVPPEECTLCVLPFVEQIPQPILESISADYTYIILGILTLMFLIVLGGLMYHTWEYYKIEKNLHELRDYIDNKREEGIPDTKIKKTLISAGWDNKLLGEFMNDSNGNIETNRNQLSKLKNRDKIK